MQSLSPAAPQRLAYVIDTLVTGGAERLVVTFAKAVEARADMHLTVFVLNDQKTPFLEEIKATQTDVICLPGKSLVDPRRFVRVVAELRRREIDFVHAHLITSTVVAGFAARLLGLPFATTIHNVKPSTARVSTVRGKLYRAVLALPGITRIAVGQAVADAAQVDTGDRPCLVVPNAVAPEAVLSDTERSTARTALRAALGFEAPGAQMVLAVGAIIGQKAYDDMLKAFSKVADNAPLARLMIAGKAPEPDRLGALEQQILDLGLEDRVQFLGLRRDIPALLAAADVFLSASHWEGAPVSLLEAMANGLPCVMTDVGDNARILAGTGTPLAPPHAPDALAEVLLTLLQSPDRARTCGLASQKRVSETYSVDAWVDRLSEIYRPAAPAKNTVRGMGQRKRSLSHLTQKPEGERAK